MNPPPCVRGCTLNAQHAPPCDRDDCGGCLPRPADIGHLCQHCYDTTRDHLTAIPELAVHAAARIDGRLNIPAPPSSEITRPGIHHASPSPAWDTADETIWWAHAWAEATADNLHHTGPFTYLRSGLPARGLTASIGYLVAQLERIVADEWAATDLPREARQHRRRLERASGRDTLTHRLREPCPSCNHRTLIREDGADSVTCRNRDCGRIWREGEYDWLAHTAPTITTGDGRTA